MGEVLYHDFGETCVPTGYRQFADEHNLVIEENEGKTAFFIHGKEFVTERGTKVGPAFGYLRPTGRSAIAEDGCEMVEVVCLRSRKVAMVPLSLLQPIRLLDSLED